MPAPSERADPAPIHDLAIVGGGLLGSLLALAFARLRPDIDLILLERGESFGGNLLEPIILDEVPTDCIGLIDSAIVKIWQRCFVILPDSCQYFGDSIALVDPRQFHLDIIESLPPERRRTACAVGTIAGQTIRTSRGPVFARQTIDTRGKARFDRLAFERQTHYRDLKLDHKLEAPVLADFSQSQANWNFRQLFPVDDQRIIVVHWHREGRFPCARAAHEESTSEPGRFDHEIGPQRCPDHLASFPCMLLYALRVASSASSLASPNGAAIEAVFSRERRWLAQRAEALFELASMAQARAGATE